MQLLGMLDVSDWSDFLHATMLFCDIKDKAKLDVGILKNMSTGICVSHEVMRAVSEPFPTFNKVGGESWQS